MELTILRPRGQGLVPLLPCLHPLRKGDILPRHVAETSSTRRHGQGCALNRHSRRRSAQRGTDGSMGETGCCDTGVASLTNKEMRKHKEKAAQFAPSGFPVEECRGDRTPIELFVSATTQLGANILALAAHFY